MSVHVVKVRAGSEERRAADLVLRGGSVATVPGHPVAADAIAIADGVVRVVGDAATVMEAARPGAQVLDLRGSVVVPGLTDCHVHPGWGAEFAQGADCSACGSLDELAAALSAERGGAARGAVVRAFGVDRGLFQASRVRGDVLERLAGGQALVTFADCHSYLATPSLLTSTGIDGELRWPDGGRIVIDEEGRPTGEAHEFSAYERLTAALPPLTSAERARRLREVLERMASLGLTGAHVMDGAPEDYDLLAELEEHGPLPLRLIVPLWLKPHDGEDTVRRFLELRDARGASWRGGAVKLFLDGVHENGTAWLEEPDTAGECLRPSWPVERFRAVVHRFAAAGFQCITHAVGDRAVRETLDAYSGTRASRGVRHRVEHNEALPDALLPRFAAADVVCSMQPLHMQWRKADGSDPWALRLGRRAARGWRTKDVLRHGALLALGSDWPVAQVDPRIGMAWARLRRRPGDRDGHVFEPDQRLSGAEALRGYTAAAAKVVGEQAVAGRLTERSRADLTVFAADPAEVPADELPDLPVRLTILDGRIVHDDGSLR